VRVDIERGKRGFRILRAGIMCQGRLEKLLIKLQEESGEEKENIEQHRKSRIRLSRTAIRIDRLFLESERRLMKCEKNFRKWNLKKLLEWEAELSESRDKEEWVDEREGHKEGEGGHGGEEEGSRRGKEGDGAGEDANDR
jgi:hypothetical protein